MTHTTSNPQSLLSPSKWSMGGLLLLCLLLAACASKKHAVKASTVVPDEQTVAIAPSKDAKKPADAKQRQDVCITSRIRLDIASGGRNTSVGGMLRMKRDDVIQLSITTFGILEVARIEMTPDYFMLIDKMGRQYVKSSYSDVSFLRDGDIDFRTLQAFFWDEQTPYVPGWERKDFVNIADRSLPTKHYITIPAAGKTIKAELTLSNLNTDSEWEKRTEVPDRYKQVSVDEVVKRIMNLSM